MVHSVFISYQTAAVLISNIYCTMYAFFNFNVNKLLNMQYIIIRLKLYIFNSIYIIT